MKIKILYLIVFIILFGGCSKRLSPTIGPENSYNQNSSVSLPQGEVTSEVAGGVTESGKYTGSDGKSASGIKMIYFSSDKYDIEPDQLKRLLSDIPKIKKLTSIGKIRVEGNCDEFGTNEYNYALGLKRAKSVRTILINQGIPANKISIVSYGESNPVCTGHTAPCHAKNRRVEINQI